MFMWSILAIRIKLKPITSVPAYFRHNNYHSLPLNHILQSCSSLSDLKCIHAKTIKAGYYQNLPLTTKLVSLASCMAPTMDYPRNMFDAMSERDVFLWNTLIRGYADRGPCHEAIFLYRKMHQSGFSPDNYTFPFVVRSCAVQSALREGTEVHCNIIKNGFSSDVFVQSSLVSMYAQNGETLNSELVFNKMVVRNIVSWTAMIAGYVKNGFYKEGLTVLRDMVASGSQPNVVTLVSILPACASLEFLDLGNLIHGHGVKVGFDSDMSLMNALIAFYGKCRNLETAKSLFDGLVVRNLVSWNAMIAAYEQNKAGMHAIKLFCRMQNENVEYDYITIVSVISACASSGALNTGIWLHELVKRKGFGTNVSVTNALIDMYAKCGNIDLAKDVFQKLPHKSVVSWTSIIGACASHGHGDDALMFFSMMKEKGIKPNNFTFIAVLSACRHSGLVDEGRKHFESMIKDYSLVPGVEHYACMVDLLGRAGCLLEAYKFIERMPVEPDVGIWGALLSACRIYGNVELAELVAAHLSELDPPYVLMLNIYAEAGRWEDEARLRSLMRQKELKKLPGQSFVVVNQRLYTFLSGSRSQLELQPMLASC
uniref:pentatricopeptide repeat-containing protein At1g08070-like n=1 Tax=Fragaria vesca subsp. vesca TaxID=101020 RepID=UPI0005CB1CE1|nr:PREDICTED: pentatricopeptide repeat-containing protein At1g08070-like [Fragaria vesca subsp. vesca]XP_011466751.1 PREDICTED: pentatricopeptide repeat-containing protein At1g08070-like [Fragaria vesca subsp. vesca]XP_011466752.1 PREDICTED: pentatricopeptide repeat-containing protein At1g08070-like [Fragaria vesca subsp. vesca]